MGRINSAIQVFRASEYYSDFLDSFSYDSKLDFRYDDTAVSKAIYYHVCKMHYAGWRHRINFNRKQKHSFSEFFQDIVAFYLRAMLPKGYEVELETRKKKTQPDIAIKLGGKYVFLIEVKTTPGWERPDEHTENGRAAIKRIKERIQKLGDHFKVPENNIIYIFLTHKNVNKNFSSKYWDAKERQRVLRPSTSPFSIIFPLFDGPDPYYWDYELGFEKDKAYKKISDKLIKDRAKHNVVTPFEEIVKFVVSNTT